MNADCQPGTVNRELTTHLHPQIMSLRAKRGNLQIYADSDSVIPAKLVLDPRSGRGQALIEEQESIFALSTET